MTAIRETTPKSWSPDPVRPSRSARARVAVLAAVALATSIAGLAARPARAGVAPPPAEQIRAKLAAYMDEAAAQGFTGAVVVARGGEVFLEKGYGKIAPGSDAPVTPETVFTVGSITKQFTAAAVLVLEQMGKLSVDDPITKYFDGVPADKRGITIDLLLSHRAGFPDAIGDDFERIGRDAFVRRAMATPLLFRPGTGYRYSNVGYSLAAAIVEKVSGEPYERFLHERLFAPAGMKDTGYLMPHWDPSRLAHGVDDDGGDWGTLVGRAFRGGGPGWNLVGNGGLHSTVGDMLRWHRALMGDAILTAASKAKLYAKHAKEPGGTWYGYGWSIEDTPWGEMVTHNGGNPYFFADFLRFLHDNVVVYYATSSRDHRMWRLARPLAQIVFTGEAPELEPPPPPLVAPGEGPAPPAGSPAARWRLPGTPAGLRAGELLSAVTTTDLAARRSFAESGFAPAMLERRGVDGLVGLLARMRGDLVPEDAQGDGFEVRGTRSGGPGEVTVVLERRKRPPMEITVKIEPAGPHRITALGVEIGD